MKAIHFTVLLAVPCLLLVACQEKSPPQSDSEAAAEPIVVDVVGTDDLSAPTSPTGYTSQYQDLLAKVNAQCPQQYPEIVTPLPEEHQLEQMSTNDLIALLDSWNPVLRMEAAKALGKRGSEAIPKLRQGTHSENNKVRAGSAAALAALCKTLPAEQLPTDLAADFIRLSTDEEHEVRVSALNALGTLSPKTPATTLAVLAMCTDPNEYLAQDAKVALNKYFSAHTLPIEDIEAGLKAAMGGPLPNGKGHIVKIIGRLKPEDQRRFIPELLEHVKWWPRRDTMFAAGGQEQAIQMLTDMRETRMLDYLPKIGGKIERGAGLYIPCLKAAQAFGKEAKPILPDFKRMLADLEAKGKESEFSPGRDLDAYIQELKKTIEQIESL